MSFRMYGFSLTSYNGVKVSKIFVHTTSFWEFYPTRIRLSAIDLLGKPLSLRPQLAYPCQIAHAP